MNSFRELLEEDALTKINDEFIRFHGPWWYERYGMIISTMDAKQHNEFLKPKTYTWIDVDCTVDSLVDLGYVSPRYKDDKYFLVTKVKNE